MIILANMCPEYGATVGFFPVDSRAIEYLRQTGRDSATLERITKYLQATGLFVDYAKTADIHPKFTEVLSF